MNDHVHVQVLILHLVIYRQLLHPCIGLYTVDKVAAIGSTFFDIWKYDIMAAQKEIIRLTEAQETLLIPLWCKSQAAQGKHVTFVDEKTESVLAGIDYNFSALNVPKQTQVTVRMRANRFDVYAREFIAAHPDGMILHLGCGLDSRCLRVDNGRIHWVDLDMPDVIALRRKFYTETERYRMIASPVTDLSWLDEIPKTAVPVLVIAEGLFMYLEEAHVKALVLALQTAFPGCRLAFDAFSALTAQRVGKHPSLQKTGASIHWGIDNAAEMATWGIGIQLVEEWFFTQSPDMNRLDFGYRLIFKIASLFSMAKKAHRLLYFIL